MSEHYINIRVLFWHLQASRGSLTAWRVCYNRWWFSWRVLRAPMAIYDFSPIEGWRCRKDGVPQACLPL